MGLSILFCTKTKKKTGLYKAQKLLNLKPEEIAVVGDQVFTDVLGANRCNMFSILTKPLAKKEIWHTKIKRPFEKIVINKYLKKKEKK